MILSPFFLFLSLWNNWYYSFNFRLALTKLISLSEYIIIIFPQQTKKKFNARINASVLKSLTISRCIACVVKQIKILTQDFTVETFCQIIVLTTKGLVKSTPHLINLRPGGTRCLGKSPIIDWKIIGCCLIKLLICLQYFVVNFSR